MSLSESNRNTEIDNDCYSNHDDEKQQMLMRIYEYEHEISRKQRRRTFLIISCASIFFFLVFTRGKLKLAHLIHVENISAILFILLISIAFGVGYYFVGISVFTSYFVANTEENKHLEEMKKEYLDKYGRSFY